ncbi:MAG TPA: twin-arginine translocase subunit TatC [Dehalococcoidia bacterium]|nr:twin-arginine translocase subunit TatC [Dehalococcoidia bacterium]
MTDENKLTFLGHLRELRTRIFWSVIAILVALPVAYLLTDNFLHLLIGIAPSVELIYTEVTEMLGTYIKVTLILAFVLALPFLVYQVIIYIRPALTKRERLYVYTLLPAIFILFCIGAVFAYLILLPPAMNFLLTFNTEIAKPMIKIANYFSVVTRLIFWVGMCFEIPLVMFFFTKIGIVKPAWLAKFRKGAILLAFVLGAIITPTFDPINQSLVAIPIIVLYEIGILLSRLAKPKRKEIAQGSV